MPDVSQFFAPALFEIENGPLGNGVKPSRADICFDLLVPFIGIIFTKPIPKGCEFLGAELFNFLLDL